MKILQVGLFFLFAAGCTSAPKLEYPTGKESVRQPINVLHPTLSETVPLKAAPAGLNPEINSVSPTNKSINSSTRNDS